MKEQINILSKLGLALCFLFVLACNNDDGNDPFEETDPVNLESTTYDLGSVSNPDITGTATFTKNEDNTVTIDLALQNTPDGGQHPAHIHFNTAAEGGDIAVTLGTVDGGSGESSVTISALDDGTAISYDQLLEFDGYINVHLSADELGTLVAQGDIGQNDLTGNSKTYELDSKDVPDISGTATFSERINGEALAVIELQNTPDNGEHPGHIHANTAAEGGAILFTFNPVDGNTGVSATNVAALDSGVEFGYAEVLDVDGYINIHLSAQQLGILVAQGDIGQNELTGQSTTYDLESVDVPDISGSATFSQRVNGETLAIIELENTPDGGLHPGHIHENTAAEGGDIAFTFNPVNGDTGISVTNIAALDNGTAITYSALLEYDGYINIHLSAEELGTLVAQGDIGQNDLTGTTVVYTLDSVDVPDISGTATFSERINGEALAVIVLMNTPAGGSHPGHIHMNSAAEGGDIAFTFVPVDGDTGISQSNVAALDDGTAFGYADVLTYDGYINIHLSAEDLGTLVAQGNIGSNVGHNGDGVVNFDVTNSGVTDYTFNGGGLTDALDPELTLTRGATYTFTVNASGHPFFIKSVQGNTNANAYNDGVTNNGEENGTVTFTVPMNAPDILYYNCQIHSAMTGVINIVD
ncbi:CHRD domain-containing protein [Zeaxanthinibacter sp. PT1]|uniref:CHRD domain-containing protein n=1 Tax=Zeaxanthinibacter TaxID=561554 RepID=UPI00234AA59A|nr:CHRD domain-containing protein [Zeaxanthinibacter sp. PT1]MDC6350275.1 CHRD domain-containing protein [Zeaxanthinibacter sp. PT1]